MAGTGIGTSPFLDRKVYGQSGPVFPNTVQNFTTVSPSTGMTWRDAPGLTDFGNGRLLLYGGWFFGSTSTREVWESFDYGISWISRGNAPWFERHSFGYAKKNGKIFVWGGDLFYAGNGNTAPKDVWVYNESVPGTYNVADWTQLTSNWGSVGGDRVLFAFCVHNNKLYMAGGQTTYGPTPTMFTDIVSYNEVTNQWDLEGTIPFANFSTGVMVSSGTHLYIYGGGQYNAVHVLNSLDIYRSTTGATWTAFGQLPAWATGLMYSNGAFMDNKLWYLNGGTTQAGAGNQVGLGYALPGGAWTLLPNSPAARHASGITVNDASDTIYIVHGNTTSDAYAINAVVQNPSIGTDAQGYINKLFPTPSLQYQTDINNFRINLGADWSLIDAIILTATEYRINAWPNFKNPAISAAEIATNLGVVSFIPNQGYQGSVANAFVLNTNWNYVTHGVNFTPTSNFQGVYSLTNGEGSIDAGSLASSRNYTFWCGNGNKTIVGTGASTESASVTSGHAKTGFLCATKIGTNVVIYRNGVSLGGNSNPSTSGLNNITAALYGSTPISGIPSSTSNRILPIYIKGGGGVNVANVTAAVQAFALARGFRIL